MRRILVALFSVLLMASFGGGPARAQAPGWRTQLTLPGGDIYAATFASPDVVWAVGSGGIFRSIDRGQSWSLVYNSPQPLNAISAAPDGMHGWAVGPLGLVVSTSDRGETWIQQASRTEANLTTVAALGDGRAITAGVRSSFGDATVVLKPHVILRTEDGGATWTELRLSDYYYRTGAIDFLPDGKHGWMASERCVPPAGAGGALGCDLSAGRTLLQTDDGGTLWRPITDGATLYDMQFVSQSAGWASGCLSPNCVSGLLRTTDGGITWQQVRPTSSTFYAFDAERAIVAERRCAEMCVTRLAQTLDGGATWSDLDGSVPRFVTVLQFASGGNGVLLGMAGSARWTATAGADWHEAQFPVVVGSGAIDFVDGSRGWLAASELLHTEDGGSTWASVSADAFTDIDFVSSTEGWATRWACAEACETTVFHTTDGGASWRQQFTTGGPNTPRLVFKTASDGWMLFESDGRALHTRDGGATWYEQSLPTMPARFGDTGRATFVDRNVGWAAVGDCATFREDCRGWAYRTLDGGDNWSLVADFATGGCYIFAAAATDARHVWFEGAGCPGDVWMMYRSTDAGSSWSAAALPDQLMAVTFFDATTGRAIAPACDQ